MKLLTRTEFKDRVFQRDNHKCVACNHPCVDAHHILDRKLFPDGGYYLDNGVSLCSDCHLKAEYSEFSCELLRELAKIDVTILPPDYDSSCTYDKWGNVLSPCSSEARAAVL